VAAIHSVICFEVSDERLDRLPFFEQRTLLIGQPLIFAPVFVSIWGFSLSTPGSPGRHKPPQALRPSLASDGALLDLFVHHVTVIRVSGKALSTHDQITPERPGQTDLHTKFVGVAALALADALHLWRVPAVELGALIHRFAAGSLRNQAFGLLQCLDQGFLHGLVECGHLGSHLAL
jgi:hypothetical protein